MLLNFIKNYGGYIQMKNINKFFFFIFIVLIAIPSYAAKGDSEAIQKGAFGFNFFSATSLGEGSTPVGNTATALRSIGVGVISHVSQSIALEPGVFFMRSHSDEEGDTLDRLYLGSSIGIYYYGNLKNNMYFYTGPRFEYAYYKAKEDNNGTSSDYETKSNSMGISAVFGLKYMFTNRFGLFADISLGYSFSKSNEKTWNSSGTLTSDEEEKSDKIYFSRGMLGVVFYL